MASSSDLTLLSDNDEYYVTQKVVCSQSIVLKEKCEALKAQQSTLLSKLTNYLSSRSHTPKTPTIDLSAGQDDNAVEAMVHYFYHGDYLPTKYEAERAKFDRDIGFHEAVLRVAKVYKVHGLEALAKELMEKAEWLEGRVGESTVRKVDEV